MIYIPSTMKFGTQSRSTSFILNMIFENCGSWPEIKNFGIFGLKIAMCSNFYEMWYLVQIEYADYEYSTWSQHLNLHQIWHSNKSDMLIMDVILASF